MIHSPLLCLQQSDGSWYSDLCFSVNFICLLWWMVCTPEDDWCFYFPLGSGWVTPCKDQGTSFLTHWVALASDWPTVFNDTFLLYDLSQGDIPKSSSIILYRGEDYKSTIQKPLFWWNVCRNSSFVVFIPKHEIYCKIAETRSVKELH